MNIERSRHRTYNHLFDHVLEDAVTVVSIVYLFFIILQMYYFSTTDFLYAIVLIDTVVCILFLFEFFYFYFKSEDKKKYVKHHFLDLIASFPFLLVFGFSGLGFLFNFFKLIRGFKSIWKIYEFLFKTKLPLFVKIMSLLFLVIVFFSILIVEVEKGHNPNINYFHDGAWWALVTLATVGYGDVVPVTIGGKIITVFLVIVGVGITSSIGALFAVFLIEANLKPNASALHDIRRGEERLQKEENTLKKGEDIIITKENVIVNKEERINSVEKGILSKLDMLEKKLSRVEKNESKLLRRKEFPKK